MSTPEELRQYLLAPEVGALCVADPEAWKSNENQALDVARRQGYLPPLRNGAKRTVFKLPSGRCTDYFVSFWEVFDNEDAFTSFIDAFETAALAIHRDPQTTYDAIATSTPTAKHILDSLLTRLHDRGLQIDHYLLDQLPLSDHETRLPDLSRNRVLILTDVISTGALIQKLASAVRRLEGLPTAVLGGVHTHTAIPPIELYDRNGNPYSIPVTYLTDLVISDSPPDDGDQVTLWRIDPFKVFPEEQGAPLRRHARSSADLVRDLEDADAIRFGFYKADWHRVFTAVHVPSFLARYADPVCDFFAEDINDADLLVTSHSRAELLLKRAISARLPAAKRNWLLLPAKGSAEGPQTHFLLPKHKQTIAKAGVDAKAVVIFFSVQTAERLRDIVSLLATYGVRSVSVLTVVDRMPTATAGFTSRLANLFRGNGRMHRTAFQFRSLYYLHEFDSHTLAALEDTAAQVLGIYSQLTRSPSFTYEFGHDCKYFVPVPVSSPRFLSSQPEPVGDGIPPVADALSATADIRLLPRTVDGRLTLLLESVIDSRDYSLVADAICEIACAENRRPKDKERMFTLFAVLLADIQYIKRTHHLAGIRRRLLDAMATTRERRLRREARGGSTDVLVQEIRSDIERETDLAVLVGIIAFFDSDFDYASVVAAFLAQGTELDGDALATSPLNLLCFYYNIRVAFACSLTLLLGYPSLRKVGGKEIGQLRGIVDGLRRMVSRYWIPDGVAESITAGSKASGGEEADSVVLTPVGLRRAILDNLTLLENDLSIDRPRERHSILRYLLRHVVDPKRDHNPVWRGLDNGVNALDLALGNHANTRISDIATKNSLETAYRAAGVAEQIAGAARSFFHFHTSAEETAVYTKTADEEDGLLAHLRRVAEGLQEVRRSGDVSRALAQQIINDWARARLLLFPDGEHQPLLVRELRAHLVPLSDVIKESLDDVRRHHGDKVPIPWDGWGDRLIEEGIDGALADDARSVQPADESARPLFILCDPVLTVEVFRNMFSNLRWLLAAGAAADVREQVRLSVRADSRNLEDGRKDYWVVRLEWPANIPVNPPGEQSTWKKHERQIERYGGSLEFNPREGYCELWALARTLSGGPPQARLARERGQAS